MLCTTSALGISWQHRNHPNLPVLSIYEFHVYVHVQIKLRHLGIPLAHEGALANLNILILLLHNTVFVMIKIWITN